jgi:hypothetical protein
MPRVFQFSPNCRNFAPVTLTIVALTLLSVAHAAAATLTIATKTLPAGYVNSVYSQTLTATGGSGTGHSWSVTSGTLPKGITLVATSGLLHGTPTALSSTALTFKVKDSAGNTATAKLTLTISPALAITTKSLPTAYVSSAYSVTLAATGGSGTGKSWSLASGSLPNGLALSTTGIISGKPTAAGSSALSIAVKDSAGNTAKASLTLVVGPQLVITTAGPLPVGYVDTNYNFTFAASGGSGTGYTWTTKSALPGSFGFTKAGVLYGLTPTADTVVLTIVLTDSAKNTASAQYTLTINPLVAQCTNDNQASALSELHGVYTFTLNRRNLSTGQLSYSIGSFDADGPGTISNGVMDSNGPGFAAATQSTFTGTYTIGSDGRGRMDLTYPAVGPSTLKQSFCFALDTFAVIKNPKPPPPTIYGVAAHAFVIEDDTSNVTSSGELMAQVVDPANSIMAGSWTFGMSGRAHYPTLLPNGPDPRFAFAGAVNFDGLGSITSGEMDEVISNAVNGVLLTPDYRPQQSLAGTYSIPTPATGTPTGRGTMSVTHDGVIFAQFVFYPYGGATASPKGIENLASGLVVLETSVPVSGTTPVHVAWAGTGARRTETTFSAADLNGWSVTSQSFVDNPGTSNESEGVGIDVDHWDGAGNFTYTGDRNAAALATTDSGKGTYTVDANGRFAVMVNGLCAPCGYLTGVNQGFGIYDSASTNAVLLERQVLPILGGPFQVSSILGAYSFGSRWYAFPQQQTATGETVTRGDAIFAGTVDTNTMGKTEVDIAQTALATATSTSGTTGRFLYQPSNTTFRYAIYVIDPYDAVAIPLGGSGSVTDPLLRFMHQ